MKNIVIIAAKRTPIGRFLGLLSHLSAVDLACHVGRDVVSGVDPADIDQVVIGNVLAAGQGMNLARQITLELGLPQSTPAFTVNMMCASGLQSILLAAQTIRAGDAQCVLCGGTESMSQSPYLLPRVRTGLKFGDAALIDSVLKDGLTDPSSRQHMGLTAETLARKYDISRAEQDEYAAASHQRYAANQQQLQGEILPVGEVTTDEHPRPDTTAERLARLKPAFDQTGTVTAGNASGMNDGAALLLLADAGFAASRGYRPLARLAAGTTVGCDPAEMGLGPVHAIRQLLSRTGTTLEDYDAVEINEAFAAQTLACLRELKLASGRINPQGGAIALGHPIGMSGARLAVHLAQQIHAGNLHSGLAALCVGGGMGIAAAFAAPAG